MTDQRIEQVSYLDEWHVQFEAEKDALTLLLGSTCRQIEHIGSTSVRGMSAKPIVDIAVLLVSLSLVPGLVQPLAGISYVYMGEFNLPGRHFFTKRTGPRFNLHIVDDSSEHWQRWLKFRDIARSDATVRQAYMELKRNLVARFANEREKYTSGKSEFINSVIDGSFQSASAIRRNQQ